MLGISKAGLLKIKNAMPDSASKLFVSAITAKCEELHEYEWQTIEEFKKDPID